MLYGGIKMKKLKCWKKRNIDLNVKSYATFTKKGGGVIWVVKSNINKEKPFRFGGVDGRGYIKEESAKTKPEALKLAENYMKKHDKC